jgi:thiol-disulfide isomerase/thioredoxin
MRRNRLLALLCCGLFLLTSICSAASIPPRNDTIPTRLVYFWGLGCPHCAKAKIHLAALHQRYPALLITSYEVYRNEENLALFMTMAREIGSEATGVPTFFLGNQMHSGFSEETAGKLDREIERLSHGAVMMESAATTLQVPLLGEISTAQLSLPLFTLIIAGLDSINPCAFFVLLFLLSLLVHAHSRRRMALIGSIFVFISGFCYFLFMAAWLNLFLLVGHLAGVTLVAGIVALLIALINVKDFFFFKQGVSLSIPDDAKPKLFERMRRLLRADSLPSLLAGTVVLAVAANSYELLCTAGFPMVFTRVLTLNSLSTSGYYGYLALYNLVYVIPLAIIVTIFTVSLGNRKLAEWEGRVLKLVSGLMMLGLGAVLLFNPALLTSMAASAVLLGGTMVSALLIIVITRRVRPQWFNG